MWHSGYAVLACGKAVVKLEMGSNAYLRSDLLAGKGCAPKAMLGGRSLFVEIDR